MNVYMARTRVDGLGCTVIALDVITASGCDTGTG